VLALAPLKASWFRIEVAAVEIAPEELRELRERDVVLTDLTPKPDRGDLVLSTGERFGVSLCNDGDRWIGTVGERVTRIAPGDQLEINLVFRLCDGRELPTTGSTIAVRREPLTLSWRDGIVGHGDLVEIEGQSGVRVTLPRRI
jgi:hypothetical protein